MIRLFVSVLLVALVTSFTPAYAADYHFCDTGGNDSNDGSSGSPWLSWTKVLDTYESAVGGDNILFCRGGTIDVTNSRQVYNTSTSDTSRVTFDAYGTGDIPIINPADNTIPLYFGSLKTAGQGNDGGINIQNLNFKCATRDCAPRAIWLQNAVSWVTMDNITVDGFVSGIHTGKFGNSDGAKDITLQNSVVKNNHIQGFYGGSDNLLIYNNTFDNNGGDEDSLDHNIYIAETSSSGFTGRIIGNKLYRNSQKYQDVIDLGTDDFTVNPVVDEAVLGNTSGATGTVASITADEIVIHLPDRDLSTRFVVGETITVAGTKTSTSPTTAVNPLDASMSANIVAHGSWNRLIIRGNLLEQGWNDVTGAFATAQAFGIGIGPGYVGGDEYFNNLVIQDNQIFNSATGIALFSGINMEITLNQIRSSTRFANGILVDRSNDDGVVTDNVNVYNNFITMNVDPRIDAHKRAIQITDIDTASIRKNVMYVNNANGSNRCINTDASTDIGTDNVCYTFTDPLAIGTNTINP